MKIVTRFLHAVAGLLGWHPTAAIESTTQKQLFNRFSTSVDAHERRREALAEKGHHKSRRAGKTRCRCFVRILGSLCEAHRHDVWCKKHRLYICLDCGRRDRSAGVL